jgi:hypothetical protein
MKQTFQLGNTFGKLNAGKPSPLRGRAHPSDCPHCANVSTGKTFDAKAYEKRRSKTRRLKKFGLTEEQYLALEASQNGVCAICGNPPVKPPTLAIDHDHATGKVRGLLCVTCNTRLGFLERRWAKIMAYLGKPA